MRKGGGKAKGAQFEREICVLLSRWLSNGERDDLFWRSAMSGGRATVSAKKDGQKVLAMQLGDISSIDRSSHPFIEAFAVECKFYAELHFQGLLLDMGKLLEFWKEIKKVAQTANKKPILFARQNRVPTMVCFDKAGLMALGLRHDEATIINPPNDLFIMPAEYFVTHTKPFV